MYLFIYVTFKSAVSNRVYVVLIDRMVREWLIWKDVEGSSSGLVWGIALAFAWNEWENHGKLVRITSLWADIWTQYLSKSKQKSYTLGCDIW
jgi:hypothetical protein